MATLLDWCGRIMDAALDPAAEEHEEALAQTLLELVLPLLAIAALHRDNDD